VLLPASRRGALESIPETNRGAALWPENVQIPKEALIGLPALIMVALTAGWWR
jgi:hypothetical protein